MDRNNFVFVGCGWAFARAEHQRNTGTVNVAVAQTDARLGLFKRDGEICRDGRFSNATFAAGNGNDVLDSRNLGGADARACARRWRVDVDQNLCAANTIESAQDLLGVIFYRRGNIWIVSRKSELHFDVAIVDVDSLDQTKRNDVSTKSRITNRAQRAANLFF